MEIKFFKKIPFLSEFSDDELKEMSDLSERRKFPPGSIVLYEGDKNKTPYLILKGRIKVVLSDKKGKEIIVSILKEGDYFGEMALFDQLPRSATVVTLEDSEFLIISPEVLLDKISKNPRLSLKLLSEMSKRLRKTDKQIGNLALLDVKGRVARILLNLFQEAPLENGKDYKTVARPPLKDIAAMSGTTRETASRILNDFFKNNLIHLTRKNIIIYDKLKNKAGSS